MQNVHLRKVTAGVQELKKAGKDRPLDMIEKLIYRFDFSIIW
jgi:hypothetical protein